MTNQQITLSITILLAIVWIYLLVMQKKGKAAQADQQAKGLLYGISRLANNLFKSFYKVNTGTSNRHINSRYEYLKAKREARERAEQRKKEKESKKEN